MEYTIKIKDQDLSVLSAAIVELPYRVAAPLIDRLNSQIEEQRRKPDLQPEKK